MYKDLYELFKSHFSSIILGSSLVLLSACGGDSSFNSENTTPSISSLEVSKEKVVGYLIDSPVAGAKYTCDGNENFTKESGEFECSSLPAKFYVGKVNIGEINNLPSDKKVFIQDLLNVPRRDIENPEVIKVALLLQSLDEDRNPENGIKISEGVHVALDENIDFKNMDLESLKDTLREKYPDIEFVAEEDTIEHLRKSFENENEIIEDEQERQEQDFNQQEQDEKDENSNENYNYGDGDNDRNSDLGQNGYRDRDNGDGDGENYNENYDDEDGEKDRKGKKNDDEDYDDENYDEDINGSKSKKKSGDVNSSENYDDYYEEDDKQDKYKNSVSTKDKDEKNSKNETAEAEAGTKDYEDKPKSNKNQNVADNDIDENSKYNQNKNSSGSGEESQSQNVADNDVNENPNDNYYDENGEGNQNIAENSIDKSSEENQNKNDEGKSDEKQALAKKGNSNDDSNGDENHQNQGQDEGELVSYGYGNGSPESDSFISKPNSPTKYGYIPMGAELTDAMAIRFLNKATFGATPKDVESLREMGVERWVDKQLSMPLTENQYLTKTIELAKEAEPDINPYTVEEYLEDNDIVFNKNKASFFSPRFMQSSWFDIALTSEDQLRHKVAYALSQIIVESDFEPIFTRRGEALSRYFDILAKNAFGSYKQLLTDISFNSGMSLFLTFNGNKKLHENSAGVKVYPDENYAREIMQLFSIGLNELNLNGTPKRDAQGNLIPTYTQEDVNELARVFTGWDLKRNPRYGLVGFTRGDLTHPTEFTPEYHDFGEKKVLDSTIPAGLSGEDDIKTAIDIIMKNQNVAPFISKQLIIRLTKSNPSPEYVQRVASVFKSTGGDLKSVVKTILMDREIWDDIKNLRSVKFKEPLIAYTESLRVMNVKPLPYWYFCKFQGVDDDEASNCTRVYNKFLFNNPKDFLGQGAGRAPTVFNFYDNNYIPNDDEFKADDEVAPEVQIQNDTVLIKFSNEIRRVIGQDERYLLSNTYKTGDGERYPDIKTLIDHAPADRNIPYYYIGANKFTVDLIDDYNFLELRIDGDTDGDFKELKDKNQGADFDKIKKAVRELIDYIDNKLTGGLTTDEEKEIIYDELVNGDKWVYNHWAGDDTKWSKHRQIMSNIIKPIYRLIITSDKFMTE